jgi:hypothetical protein
MKTQCKVTFEFLNRQPLTWQGEIEATQPETVVRKAVQQARLELSPRNWTSLICVILEREGVEAEEESEE